jgi:hypothetical protein
MGNLKPILNLIILSYNKLQKLVRIDLNNNEFEQINTIYYFLRSNLITINFSNNKIILILKIIQLIE